MNENLDLTELLKDCPEGTKFYSSYLGKDVFFIGIHNNDIECKYHPKIDSPFDCMIEFRKNGSLCKDGECMLFPSKDQRDWSKWHGYFKDGDILSYQNKSYKNRTIYIYKYHSKMNTSYYVALSGCYDSDFLINDGRYGTLNAYNDTARFATEEEKQKLFQAIKDNGYKWNAETKTLEKLIVPNFKVGDTIQSKIDNNKFTITIIDNEFYYGCGKNGCGKMCEFMIPVVKQDNWELVPDKFDPKTLNHFDKVLVRQYDLSAWCVDFFSYYDKEGGYAVCTGESHYDFCVPYNDDTKHLVSEIVDAPEFYRYWEK